MSSGGYFAAIAALTILICGNAASQAPDRQIAPDSECIATIQKGMSQVRLGHLAEAGENLSVGLRKFDGRAGDPCAGPHPAQPGDDRLDVGTIC